MKRQYLPAVAEKPLPKKKFEALLKSVRSGELKLADIEVPPPSIAWEKLMANPANMFREVK